jgi:hypothetical protein
MRISSSLNRGPSVMYLYTRRIYCVLNFYRIFLFFFRTKGGKEKETHTKNQKSGINCVARRLSLLMLDLGHLYAAKQQLILCKWAWLAFEKYKLTGKQNFVDFRQRSNNDLHDGNWFFGRRWCLHVCFTGLCLRWQFVQCTLWMWLIYAVKN